MPFKCRSMSVQFLIYACVKNTSLKCQLTFTNGSFLWENLQFGRLWKWTFKYKDKGEKLINRKAFIFFILSPDITIKTV